VRGQHARLAAAENSKLGIETLELMDYQDGSRRTQPGRLNVGITPEDVVAILVQTRAGRPDRRS
jgi:hypothetical protein